MAEITAATVKELRERSGAGMMDCKKALAENGGDVEAAVDWLRAKGLAAAQKKSSRKSRSTSKAATGFNMDAGTGHENHWQLADGV